MFFTLLLITFALSVAVSLGAVALFKNPLSAMFHRIIQDPISTTWVRYITFATCVVGISGGVRIHQLERYVTAQYNQNLLELTAERWTIEIYRTVIETLQAIAWMYLVVFIFALIAYVIVRGFELKNSNKTNRAEAEKRDDHTVP